MDITNWSSNQIMQLPDHLFGRKYMISTFHGQSGLAVSRAQSEMSLPNKCVIWGVFFNWRQVSGIGWRMGMRLGKDRVTGTTPWDQLDRLFRTSVTPRQSYDFWGMANADFYLSGLREYVEAAGQKLQVLLSIFNSTGFCEGNCGIVVSSVPTEIPDWFLK